jgi:hypothetical protein
VSAILAYPEDPPGGMSMESLATALVREGDLGHAEDLRRLIHSVRRGDATTFVRAPGQPRHDRLPRSGETPRP